MVMPFKYLIRMMENTKKIETQGLERFLLAQERDFEIALTEISYGRKLTHWMWYIFPQIQGLDFSDTAKFYAIKDLKEAIAYFLHPVLGPRLVKIAKELIRDQKRSAVEIFGSPDDLKLRSSMTLFSSLPVTDPVFKQVLDHFFAGQKDQETEKMLSLQAYR